MAHSPQLNLLLGVARLPCDPGGDGGGEETAETNHAVVELVARLGDTRKQAQIQFNLDSTDIRQYHKKTNIDETSRPKQA